MEARATSYGGNIFNEWSTDAETKKTRVNITLFYFRSGEGMVYSGFEKWGEPGIKKNFSPLSLKDKR